LNLFLEAPCVLLDCAASCALSAVGPTYSGLLR
jgi:hypothetical protein